MNSNLSSESQNNSKRVIKILVLFITFIFIGLFIYFGGPKYLTFEALKENKDVLKAWTQNNLLLSIGIFFTIYVISTALSLPGAAILTLASGALFGLGLGTLISSFASTIGAGLAFLGARYLLKDWVEAKFGSKLKGINDGVKSEGAYYLFTLRLMPVFPFFLINLLMGLTPISFWTYFFVSQISMLPGTAIYVNAGTQLSEINSTKDILSPELILSFVLLGFFPILIKKTMSFIKKKY
jgi:uncharacterized membrane protein YdjX (TVP38/TMEM64 family)